MKRMPPKAVRFWTVTACVFGLIVYSIGVLAVTGLIVGAGVAVMAVALSFNLMYYRCSYCGKHLGRSAVNYCPYCGEKLDEEGE